MPNKSKREIPFSGIVSSIALYLTPACRKLKKVFQPLARRKSTARYVRTSYCIIYASIYSHHIKAARNSPEGMMQKRSRRSTGMLLEGVTRILPVASGQ